MNKVRENLAKLIEKRSEEVLASFEWVKTLSPKQKAHYRVTKQYNVDCHNGYASNILKTLIGAEEYEHRARGYDNGSEHVSTISRIRKTPELTKAFKGCLFRYTGEPSTVTQQKRVGMRTYLNGLIVSVIENTRHTAGYDLYDIVHNNKSIRMYDRDYVVAHLLLVPREFSIETALKNMPEKEYKKLENVYFPEEDK